MSTDQIILTSGAVVVLLLLAYPTYWATRALHLWYSRLSNQDRFNVHENLLVGGFASVTSGLIMQGLVAFARNEMGLTGIWPYLLFAALDGMAAFFALVSYRWAKLGASALGPRCMVLIIVVGSSWFQYSHAAAEGQTLAARAAWALMPIVAAVLWETALRNRRKQWSNAQEHTRPPLIPPARWLWDPIGSALISRQAALWNVSDLETALNLHATRTETQRMLRQHFGPRWRWKAPAEITIRLRKGHRLDEAHAEARKLLERLARDQGTAPESDPAVFTDAVLHYQSCMDTGLEPSERALCDRFGVSTTKRRWAKKVIAHAHKIHHQTSDETTPTATERPPRPKETSNA